MQRSVTSLTLLVVVPSCGKKFPFWMQSAFLMSLLTSNMIIDLYKIVMWWEHSFPYPENPRYDIQNSYTSYLYINYIMYLMIHKTYLMICDMYLTICNTLYDTLNRLINGIQIYSSEPFWFSY